MKKVTRLLLVASVAAMGVGGFSACTDDVTIVEPPPPAPPPPPPPGPVTNPSIQIASITNVAGNVINPSNVTGQINVVLNVEPGTGNTLQSVAILVDGVVVNSQTFSSASVSAAEKGEVKASASASADPTQVTLPFDTRSENDDGERYVNGQHSVTARMTHSGGTVNASQQTLTFANANIPGAVTFSGTSASNATGTATWYGGGADVMATCSGTMFDSPASSFAMTTAVGAFGSSSPFSTTVGDDLVVSATATLPASAGANAVEASGTVTCTLPATSSGWDFNGDGDADDAGDIAPGSSGPLTRTLNLDNVAPSKPAAGNYTFTDARNTAAQTGAPANNWANASTTFGISGAVDGGVGVVEATFGTCTFDGFNNRWSCTGDISSGADVSETTNTTSLRLGPVSLADALGNATTFVNADFTTCSVCSNTFGVDKTPPAYASIRPSGIPFLHPTLAGDVNVVTDFTVADGPSGINWSGAGTTVASQATAHTVRANGTSTAFTVSPAGANGEGVGAPVAHDLVVAGLSTVGGSFDGAAMTVSGQLVDLAGNLTAFPGTSTTVDNSPPSISITQPLSGTINAVGTSSVTASFAGSASDATSGLASISSAGFLDDGNPPGAGGALNCGSGDDAAFTATFADKGTEDLGTGPSWATSYTLFSTGSGTTDYCFNVLAIDLATWLNGSANGANTSTPVNQGTSVSW